MQFRGRVVWRSRAGDTSNEQRTKKKKFSSLARPRRKSGDGHGDFFFYFSVKLTCVTCRGRVAVPRTKTCSAALRLNLGSRKRLKRFHRTGKEADSPSSVSREEVTTAGKQLAVCRGAPAFSMACFPFRLVSGKFHPCSAINFVIWPSQG